MNPSGGFEDATTREGVAIISSNEDNDGSFV